MPKAPFYKTIVPVIDSILNQLGEEGIPSLLSFIRYTNIPENHDSVIESLERAFYRLPNKSKKRWEVDFKETIIHILAQKEKVDKVTIFVGRLNKVSIGRFLRDLSHMDMQLLNSTKIDIAPSAEPNSQHFKVTLKSTGDYLPSIFSNKSEISKHSWPTLFKQTSGLVISVETTQNGCDILSDEKYATLAVSS
jgi:hypothetical protein